MRFFTGAIQGFWRWLKQSSRKTGRNSYVWKSILVRSWLKEKSGSWTFTKNLLMRNKDHFYMPNCSNILGVLLVLAFGLKRRINGLTYNKKIETYLIWKSRRDCFKKYKSSLTTNSIFQDFLKRFTNLAQWTLLPMLKGKYYNKTSIEIIMLARYPCIISLKMGILFNWETQIKSALRPSGDKISMLNIN